MTTALALLASLLWGTSDFLGGTAARRIPVLAVVAVSQGFALVGVAVFCAAAGAFGDPTGYFGWAVVAAIVGMIALTAFYAALAEGTMSVVAPIAALGVVVPVAVGLVQGDRPSAWQGLGAVLAVMGVVLASGPELSMRRARQEARAGRPLMLAVLAAVGFGTVVVCISHGARFSTPMTLLVMRATTVLVVALLWCFRRVDLAVARADLPMLAVVGAFDVSANGALAVATTRGLLSVVAVLSSLYPAVTVTLARAVHQEQLQRVQTLGVVGALAGVVLIASG